jgi:hypothetical protein
MLTARGFSLSEQDLHQTNIRQVLVKPFSPREVLSTVRQILDAPAPGTPDGLKHDAPNHPVGGAA